MKAKMFRALMPVVIVLTMMSCSSDSSEATSNEVLEVQSYTYTESEIDLMNRINAHRVSQGLNELQPVEHISFKSFEHNEYMIENNVVGHQQFESRASNIKQVLGAVKVGENVAFNYQSNNGVLQAWLASEGHKENIEGNYTHFGISISIDPETGRKYYTNIFMKR